MFTLIRIKYSKAEEKGKTKLKTFVCGCTKPDGPVATLKVAGVRGDIDLI